MRMFLDETRIWINGLDGSPKCRWHHPVYWGLKQNKKTEEGGIYLLFLSHWLNQDISGHLLLTLDWDIYTMGSPDSEALNSGWMISPAFLGLQFAGDQSWDFLASITTLSPPVFVSLSFLLSTQTHTHTHTHTQTRTQTHTRACVLLVPFPGESWLMHIVFTICQVLS